MIVSELKEALKRFGFDNSDPLLTWLNAAMHEIEMAHTKWPFLEATETKILALVGSEDGRFNLAGSAKRIIKVRDVTNELSSGGQGKDLEFMDRRALQREFPNLKAKGKPEVFSILGSNTIQVYPVQDSERTLEVTYISRLADLKGESEEPEIPEAYHYLIVLGAAYVALQAENEEDRAANAQAEFEGKLSKIDRKSVV